MPNKPLRPCKKAGCITLTSTGYCDKHTPVYIDNRLSPDKRGYDAKWRKVRAEYLTSNPMCEVCSKHGIHTIAVLVHHIRRIVDGGATLDKHNLMSLCDECHREIHKNDVFKKSW